MDSSTRKKLLLIAFHFPPVQGSTGVHRSLAFARYLERYGWDVAILTATPSAYPEHSEDNNALVPGHVRVIRAPALDAQRHFSLFGRYPLALATPDRWRTWIYSGTLAGRRLIRDWRPHAIFSTFPIPSAHEIALRLSGRFGLPWIADFRDPLGQERYPADERMRRIYWDLERRVLHRCTAVTVTTEGTAQMYRSRYPAFPSSLVRVIPNGFDELAFPEPAPQLSSRVGRAGPVRLLHSGLLDPRDRNPDWFFRAIAELRTEGRLTPGSVRFVLRAAGHTEHYQSRLVELGLEDMISLLPGVPYRDALHEMCEADALLLFQAASCNMQIPAKLYEYLYVGRPIVAFTDSRGETARLLAALGVDTVAPLDDVAAIKELILRSIERAVQGNAFVPTREAVMKFSRSSTTAQLAKLLDEVLEIGASGQA